MNETLLWLYHHAPYPLRVVAATLAGVRRSFWRYGRETPSLVRQALDRETIAPAEWQTLQSEQVSRLLRHSVTKVPYYQDLWAKECHDDDRGPWQHLENWPVLRKEAVRRRPRAFIADDSDRDQMYHLHTSGTTGTPLDLWQSRETVRQWYALFEARWRRWYGVSRHDRWAILGGQLVVSVSQKKPPFWVWNAGLRQLYMSSYHLASDNAEAYFEAMRRYRVCYVWGYASSLYTLAQVALEQKLEPPNLKVAISNAEPLYDYQREAISEAFRCPVYTTYGMTEAVCAASECEAGYLHLWPEVGIVEVLDDVTDDPLPPGEVGRLVCTGLLNFNMPLIRYETGDRGAVAPLGEICACGRTLPIIRRIEGRMDDVIVTPDGRRIGRLDPVFKGAIPVIEAQIIQEHLENIRVRFVPAANYTESDGVEIVRQLQNYIGDIDIELEAVDRIPRTDNGKFRSVISKVNVK